MTKHLSGSVGPVLDPASTAHEIALRHCTDTPPSPLESPLRQNHSSSTQLRQKFLQIAGSFRALSQEYGDTILSVFIYRNQRHTGGSAFGETDRSHVDAGLPQTPPQTLAKLVIAHLCNHADGKSEAPHSNRLIGALSAMKGFKCCACNGLSRCGYSLSSADQV